MQRLNWFLSFQNVTANHRANDVIAAEDGPQVLVGRFMYGPLDMVALTGEKVQKLGPPSWVPDGIWAEGCREGLAARGGRHSPRSGRANVSEGWTGRFGEAGVAAVEREGGSQELALSGDPEPCGLGRELPSPAPSPAFSESPGPLASYRWTSW